MGVLACDRNGCEHIMCDIIITTQNCQYYICHDCLQELTYAKNNWAERISKADMSELVDQFFETRVDSVKLCNRDDIFKGMISPR